MCSVCAKRCSFPVSHPPPPRRRPPQHRPMELVQRDEPAGLQRHAGKLLARPPEQQLLRPASTREACEQSRRRRPLGSRFVRLLVLPPSSLPCYIHATPHPFFLNPSSPISLSFFTFPPSSILTDCHRAVSTSLPYPLLSVCTPSPPPSYFQSVALPPFSLSS